MTSIAKLGDFMNTEKKTKRTHQYVEPNYLKKLCRSIGNDSAAAKKLGMTASAVSSNLRAKKTKLVTELAAEAILRREFPESGGGKRRVAVINAEAHIIKTVKDILAAAGGQIYLMPENND